MSRAVGRSHSGRDREGEIAYDFVVVGSGPAGGVVAHALTEGGARCLLIEAGREYGAETFPENEAEAAGALFWSGGLDLSADARMAFLRGKCLGGTSVVNQCLLDRFDEQALAEWRSVSGLDLFDPVPLDPYYGFIESRLQMHTFGPAEFNRNARIFSEASESLGYGWTALRRGQSDCTGADCIVCLGGCRRDSKQSTLVTFIRDARAAGLEIRTLTEIDRISVGPAGVRLFGRGQGDHPFEMEAPRVVLAAGAFGTTQILLRSGFAKRLPALGHGFYCHPQLMAFARFDDPVDAHRGAFQTVKSDDPRFRKAGFKLENVFVPPTSLAMLVPGFGRDHQERMRHYRHYASMEVAVRDTTPGSIAVSRAGRLKVRKSLDGEDRRRGEAGMAVVRELFEAAGALEVLESPFSFGLHLMGGCAIGTDARRSVVDPTFRLHGYSNVFACDSSIFPSAPGINPALTIMALARRATEEMVA